MIEEDTPAPGVPSPGRPWSPPEAPVAGEGPPVTAPSPYAAPLMSPPLTEPLMMPTPPTLPPVLPTQAPVAQPPRPSGRRVALVVACIAALLAGLGAVVRLGPLAPAVPRAAGAADPGSSGGSAPSSSNTGPVGYENFDDGARQVLARMTAALQTHDAAAFQAVASPGAAPMRERLRRMYSALSALPLASFSFEVDPERTSDELPSPQPEAHTLPVRATYTLAGWDPADVRVPLTFVATRTPDGGWGLAEDRTAKDGDSDDRLEPWALDDVYVTKTAHVLVVGDRGHQPQARRLATTLEGLVGDVRAVWPEPSWNGKVVAYAVTTPTFVRSWFGRSAAGDSGNGDRASFVAKVATLDASSKNADRGAIRMVVTPYLLGSPRAGYTDILRHELTHVATAGVSDHVPVWLVEGAAEYTGFARRSGGRLQPTRTLGEHGLTSAEVSGTARGTWRPTLADGDAFYTGSAKAVDERYNSAFITCLYISDHYGEASLRRLYQKADSAGEAQVLRQVLHTDRKHLIAATGAYATTLRQRLVFN